MNLIVKGSRVLSADKHEHLASLVKCKDHLLTKYTVLCTEGSVLGTVVSHPGGKWHRAEDKNDRHYHRTLENALKVILKRS